MAVSIKLLVLLFAFVLPTNLGSGQELSSDNYDFIVVGGGLSGCVVAGRLSENYSVLLLEEGGDPGDILDIPATMFSLIGNEKYTKVYKSVPQTNAGLGSKGVLNFMIGKTLGGGSSVNGMVYNRGNPLDYDNWANVTGDPSWSYTNLLRIFKKIEDYQADFPNDEQHGMGGPISIETSKYAPGLKAWLEAGKSLGYPTTDPNGPQKIGFTPLEFARRHGKRVSAFTGYVKPFLESRQNLKVIQHASVKRIQFSIPVQGCCGSNLDQSPRAVGVKYATSDGKMITLRANKEVIISAGTMDSAALLMRSGVGPQDVLETNNITPVKILPVGHGLVDHVVLKMDFGVDKSKSEIFIPERDLTPDALKLYEETGEGPYVSCSGAHAQALLVSEIRKLEQAPQPNWPDIKLFHLQSPGKLGLFMEMRDDEDSDQVTISTMAALVRPKSHQGRITLNSSDVDAMPLIDFQFFSHPNDMQILLEAVKMTLKIYEETVPFQQQGARFSTIPYGPCSDLPFRSDDYWRCVIRHMAGSGLHAGGSCRMGRGEEDPSSVVDSSLKVLGVERLRVVDLSIMPTVTNANTQAVAYVIAEKACEMILEEWDGKQSEQESNSEDKINGKDEL